MTAGSLLPKRGYTIKEAAQYLGIGEDTVKAEITAKHIGVKRRGATVLIDVKELDRYFDSLPSERVKKA